MYKPRAGRSPGDSTYRYIKTFHPLPWQIEPWHDTSPILLLTGSAGGGKALALDTPVLTLVGWKTMGDVTTDDFVFGEDGLPTRVIAVTPTLENRKCYKVVFSTGEEIVADAQHLWFTRTISERRAWMENERRGASDRVYGAVRTTEDILQTLTLGEGRSNHAVRVAPAIQTPIEEPLFIPPYALGAWLGDGHSKGGAITCHPDDYFIIERVLSCGYQYGTKMGEFTHSFVGFGYELDALGLINNKHIPEVYFTASHESRMELLRGLMDTDGTIDTRGRVEICQVNKRLIDDIQKLLSTLGIRSSVIANRAGYIGHKQNAAGYRVETGTRYRISFYTDKPVFALPRKAERCMAETTDRINWRYITDVEPVESVPVRCIRVESEDGMFLVGNSLIPTHNSVLAAEKLHGFCLRYAGATVLAMRKIRATLPNSVIASLERQIIGSDPRVVHRPSLSRFDYQNGSILAYGGMADDKQREHIRSFGQRGGLDLVWMEEATQFEEEDFNEVLARMRGTATSWRQIILTTNPDSPAHWINVRLILGGEASVYYSRATDNPWNPHDYLQSLDALSGVQKQRLVQGLWVIGSGVVFDTWLDEYNPATKSDRGGNVTAKADYVEGGGPVFWSIDDGYSGELEKKSGMFVAKSHPRCFLLFQRRANGQLAIFDEHYAVQTLATDHIARVLEMCQEKGYPKPDYVIRDRASASLGGAIKSFGFREIYNQMTVDESIKEMREMVSPDSNGFRRLICHPRCRHLRYEMLSYGYDNAGRVIKDFDHGPDAARYACWEERYGASPAIDIATMDGAWELSKDV